MPRILLPLALSAVLLAGCDKTSSAALESVRATDSIRGEEKTVDELKRDIARFQADADRTVRASENLGTYYRLLAVAYLNRQMYGEALDSLEHAIRYYPENEQLSYYAGVAAARMAKAQTDAEETRRLLELAEKYYERTVFLYGDHRDALFGLAVLYAVEMNRPAEALPLLERVLARDTSYTAARMLQARVHVAMGNVDQAIDVYSEIARSDVDNEIKTQALDNIRQLEGALGPVAR